MRASSEPVTSAFTIEVEGGGLAGLDLLRRCPRAWRRRLMTRGVTARPASRCQCSRVSATDLEAVFSSGATTKRSPASATSERPSTCTGVDGPASLTWLPWSSMSARTGPRRPRRPAGRRPSRVPRCTRTVATGPRPTSRWDSSTTPVARPSGLARRSSSSANDEEVVEQVVDAQVLQGGDLDHDRCRRPRPRGRGRARRAAA